MPMLRKHSDDQLKHIKNMIKKQGGDISKKLKGDVGDDSTVDTLDHPIDLSDNEPNANTKTDKQLKNLPMNSLITKFESFIKLYENHINLKKRRFNIKGEVVDIDMYRGKIYNFEEVYNLDLSYDELVESGIWNYLVKNERYRSLGERYQLEKHNYSKYVGTDLLCWNDKKGTFGGKKPLVTEGKSYQILKYYPNVHNERFRIINDINSKSIISCDRFCRTEFDITIDKYNI